MGQVREILAPEITKIVRVLTENVELAAVFPRYLIPNILERGIQIQM